MGYADQAERAGDDESGSGDGGRRGPEEEREHVEHTRPQAPLVGKQPRRGAHADERVVFAVLQRVDGVVADGPEDAACIERDGVQTAYAIRLIRLTAAPPTSAPHENTIPSHACGHQVMRFISG
jgi:hypothetical protein